MSDAAPGTSSGRRRSIFDWKAVLGILVSLGLLYFAFRGVDLGEVARHLGRANLWWLALAAAAATAVFPLRAIRWGPLLRPVEHTRFRPRFAATNIGFMANNLLPARLGEFVRAYALGRVTGMPVSAAFGSLVVERLLDGIIVVGFLFAAMAAPGFPDSAGGGDFAIAARIMLALLAAAAVVLIGMVLRPEAAIRVGRAVASRVLPESVRRPVVDALVALVHGLSVLRSPRLMFISLVWSVLLWLTGALSFWVGFLAFGIDVPFSAAVFLQSLVGLGVSLPSAPGFFGLYEGFARLGLVSVYGVAPAQAVGFAIGFHIGGFVPITLIGLWYAWRVGLSRDEVLHSEEAVELEVEAEEGIVPQSAGGDAP